jgi:hypothetical protein
MPPRYRIFFSPEGEWYVAAKLSDGSVDVLYEGHGKERAYEAILKDMGVVVPRLEREMDAGTYEPVPGDWA